MKTISLYQPWATLCVIGAKRFETRSWSTNYRGPLLIHASKKFTGDQQLLAKSWPFFDALIGQTLHTGAIVGQVDLVDCITTELCWTFNKEFHFGDFSLGRFAWQLENPIKFDKPIPAKGSLGIWEYTEEL